MARIFVNPEVPNLVIDEILKHLVLNNNRTRSLNYKGNQLQFSGKKMFLCHHFCGFGCFSGNMKQNSLTTKLPGPEIVPNVPQCTIYYDWATGQIIESETGITEKITRDIN